MACYGRHIYVICFTITLVTGAMVQSNFRKTPANGTSNMVCAIQALGMDYVATKVDDASGTCTSLDWTWGENPTYDAGFTYYEKTHTVEVFETPLISVGVIKLPIPFNVGARIDMYVEFTTLNFSYGYIQLVDTLDEYFHVYSGEAETLMILMEVRSSGTVVQFKTWYYGWYNYAVVSSPFTVGPTFKITFKALADHIEILVDDTHLENINYHVSAENAKMVTFGLPGAQMSKIEFVGV